jgi:hypothetical protein
MPEGGFLVGDKPMTAEPASEPTHVLYYPSLRADDRNRTGNIQLGRLTLYQLSYVRTHGANGGD